MTGRIEARLAELGIALPPAAEPRAARILTAKRVGEWLFLSGAVPRRGDEICHVGKVGRELSLEEGRAAARLSMLNVLAAAKKALDGDLDRIVEIVRIKGYVNIDPEFTRIAETVNGASELLIEVFGEAGRHARTAIGVAGMPFGVAIEVEALMRVAPWRGLGRRSPGGRTRPPPPPG